jgi:hypothetical protein
MLGNSGVAERLARSQGLSSIEVVYIFTDLLDPWLLQYYCDIPFLVQYMPDVFLSGTHKSRPVTLEM